MNQNADTQVCIIRSCKWTLSPNSPLSLSISTSLQQLSSSGGNLHHLYTCLVQLAKVSPLQNGCNQEYWQYDRGWYCKHGIMVLIVKTNCPIFLQGCGLVLQAVICPCDSSHWILRFNFCNTNFIPQIRQLNLSLKNITQTLPLKPTECTASQFCSLQSPFKRTTIKVRDVVL